MPNHSRTTSYTNGHIALFYTTLAERLELLAHYFKEGLAANEQCVLATPGSPEQAVRDLQVAGLDAQQAYGDGSLQIVGMYQTYMPDGDFMPDTMLANVTGFIENSTAKGYSGLRAAGEMRWINVYPGFRRRACRYESDINDLCGAHHDFLGLCMYPLLEGSLPVLQGAVRTHPAFIYGGHMRINPYAENSDAIAQEDVSDLAAFTSLLAQA